MTDNQTRWGVPNWRDEDAYPDPEHTSLLVWRWEFTRRRPDYRALWEKWAPINEAQINKNRALYERLAEQQGSTIDLFFVRAPTDDPDWLRSEFRMSVLLNPAKTFPETELWQETYNISGYFERTSSARLVSQYVDLITQRGGPDQEQVLASLRDRERRERLEEEKGLVRYVFNLSKPLEPQLRQARDMLRSIQQENSGRTQRRAHPNKWRTYLRVIDSRDDVQNGRAPSWDTIAREVLRYTRNEPQAARQVWEQARELMFNFPN